MSLLEKDIVGKELVNKLLELKLDQELDAWDEEKYKVKLICENKVYAKEAIGQILKLHYLVS